MQQYEVIEVKCTGKMHLFHFKALPDRYREWSSPPLGDYYEVRYQKMECGDLVPAKQYFQTFNDADTFYNDRLYCDWWARG